MVKNRILKNYFAEILLLFALGIITTILMLSWSLNYHFEKSTTHIVNTLNREFLAENHRIYEYLQKNIRISGMELFLEPSIQRLMYRKDLENFDAVLGIRRLDAVMSANVHIHSIYVYNAARRYVYATSNTDSDRMDRFRDKNALTLLSGSADHRRLAPIPRFLEDSSGGVPVYSFVFYDIRKTEPRIGGALVMNFTLEWLREVFKDTDTSNSRVMFVDTDGTVVYHSDSSMFLKNIDSDEIFRRMKDQGEPAGFFSSVSGADEVFVFYSKGLNDSLYLVRVYPYEVIMGDIIARRWTTLVLVLVWVPLAMALAVLISRRLYRPIGKLVQRVGAKAEKNESRQGDIGFLSSSIESILSRAESVEETSESYRKMLQADILRDALVGKTRDPRVLKDQFLEYELPFSGSGPFQLAGFRPFHETSLGSLMTGCGVNEMAGVMVDGHRGLILLGNCGQGCLDALCRRAIDMGALLAVRDVNINSIGDLPDHAAAVLEELRFSFLHSGGTVLDCPEQGRNIGAAGYPHQMEKEILSLLRQGKADDAYAAYLEFFEEVIQWSFSHFRFSMKRLYISVQLLAKEMGEGFESPDEMDIGTFEQSLEELEDRESLDRFFRQRFVFFESVLLQAKALKNHALVELIKETARMEYSNPNLCQQFLADRVKLSVSHVSKIFKEAEGISISDYCLDIRMEKVTSLLAETDIPVRDAAAAAGFSNENYFYTLFRKRFGMTPGEYRKRYKLR